MAETDFSGANKPYNLDAEQSVLGAILLDSQNNMPKASAKLHPEHFYIKIHSAIYTIMSQMFAASDTIDIVTVLEACNKNSVFDSSDEAKVYLTRLMEFVPSISSIDRYIEIIEEKYTRRQLIAVAEEILQNSSDSGAPTTNLLELAERRVYEIRNDNQVRGLVKINGVIVDILNDLSALAADPERQNGKGLKSGFPTLDKYIYGLNKSDLIIIAARPGMG
ncbi:MAG: replicative DNA helicase, partial [Ruminiclostridium sp.]|nr:replicative DNA helicase [Ruminiclostridium sp.]